MKRIVRVKQSVWVSLGIIVLFSILVSSESLAVSAADFTGTWSGTWTSQAGEGSGSLTLILSGKAFGSLLVDLTGTLTMAGKPTISQVPMTGQADTEGNVFLLSGIPTGELALCTIKLVARNPDISATRIAGAFNVAGLCQAVQGDLGIFEIRKAATTPPPANFSSTQQFSVSGDAWSIVCRYDYNAYDWSCADWANGNYTYPYTLPVGAWKSFYLWDDAARRWVEGLHLYGQPNP